MRKTSQDGGDTTSITSGVENEIKKTGAIIKTKKNSIKRKVQSLSHESDDAVIEPLLQKDKEKTETQNQSAKYNLLAKTKTDSKNEKESDKEKLLEEDKTQDLLLNDTENDGSVDTPIHSSNAMPKYTTSEAPLHNHMNTNVFNSSGAFNCFVTAKSQVLVEIETSKQSGLKPSPLIFTTAKIHTNDIAKHMEPLQVTPVPIISTVEGSILKGINKNKVGTPGQSSVTSNVANFTCNTIQSNKNITEKDQTFKMADQQRKIVDVDDFSDRNCVTQSKNTVAIDPPVVKDFKIGSKLPLSTSKGISPQSIQTPATVNLSGAASCTTIPSPFDRTEKSTVLRTTETETDLNKNRTSVDQSNNFGHSFQVKPQESVSSNLITSNKLLQRQKNAIDGDDTTNQLASTIVNKPHGIVPSVTKTMTQVLSSNNDIKSTKNANNFSKSNATDIHITSASNKPSGSTVLATSANKLATSNSVTHVNPIVKTNSIFITNPVPPISKVTEISTTSIPQTLIIAKPPENNIITCVSGGKSADSVTFSKLPTNVTTNKAPTVVSSVGATNVSVAGVPSVSNKQIVTTANHSVSTSITPSISKTPQVSTSTTKSLPASSISVKAPASATKNYSAPSTSAKVSKAITNTISTTTASKPTLATTTNNSGVSKVSPVSTMTTTKPNATAGSVSHVTTKNSVSVTVPVTSSTISTSVNSATSDSTSLSTQSQKGTQELRNGNKKLNA